jgi:hydroxymethylpyrimidine/phosphomethylpyrimidine kinase
MDAGDERVLERADIVVPNQIETSTLLTFQERKAAEVERRVPMKMFNHLPVREVASEVRILRD